MDLHGRVALVTGAGIRLGRALSEGLAARGMRLALHYNQHRAEAEELASRIRNDRPHAREPQALCFPADLRYPQEARALVESVEQAMGPVDVAILSAAIYPREPIDAVTPESLDEALRVNLSSPFLLALAAGRRMRERGEGNIVALLDWSIDRPYTDRIPYTIAKAGLRAGVLGLSRALAPEVRVNAIAPGAVLLPEGTTEELRERIRSATPLRRIGQPDDVVGAALYLLDSEFVTGTILYVDGGRTVA